MRKLIMSAIAIGATALVWAAAPANAATSTVWEQDFSVDASGWVDASNGWYGTITHNAADSTATVTGTPYGPFTKFDGFRDTWKGDWMAEQDVYLDPSWAQGMGFDYSVAATGTDGLHQRDFIFHVAVDEHGLWVGASNNTNYEPRNRTTPAADITQAGWYTLQQVFTDNSGVLAVTMNVLDDAGNTVFTTTRSNPADTIPGEVGGNRYGWFTFVDVTGGLQIDNTRLSLVVPGPGTKDDCKNGGFATFGYDNQGQCVASVTANEHAGK
jgi:hypothetical protein